VGRGSFEGNFIELSRQEVENYFCLAPPHDLIGLDDVCHQRMEITAMMNGGFESWMPLTGRLEVSQVGYNGGICPLVMETTTCGFECCRKARRATIVSSGLVPRKWSWKLALDDKRWQYMSESSWALPLYQQL